MSSCRSSSFIHPLDRKHTGSTAYLQDTRSVCATLPMLALTFFDACGYPRAVGIESARCHPTQDRWPGSHLSSLLPPNSTKWAHSHLIWSHYQQENLFLSIRFIRGGGQTQTEEGGGESRVLLQVTAGRPPHRGARLPQLKLSLYSEVMVQS